MLMRIQQLAYHCPPLLAAALPSAAGGGSAKPRPPSGGARPCGSGSARSSRRFQKGWLYKVKLSAGRQKYHRGGQQWYE